MFVGADDGEGVLALVVQLIHNARDLHLEGLASRLEVEIHPDHFSVTDDGPGIAKRDLVPRATRARRDPSARPSPRRTNDSQANLGLALVNSLSRRLEIVTCRHGARRRWVFEAFEPVVNGERLGRCEHGGTMIRVWPDPEVFRQTMPNRIVVEQQLRALHRLRPALHVFLDGERFDEAAGTAAWVADQHPNLGDSCQVHHIDSRRGTTQIDIAWAWVSPFASARCLSYVNLDETREDGSHVDGLIDALAQIHAVSPAMARERTLALISMIDVNPQLTGPARARLDDPQLQRWITELVEAELREGG